MGYMGMGMQKWIYTMKPRKPFSKKRKGSFTNIPLYKRTFKIQPSNRILSSNKTQSPKSKFSNLFGIFLFSLFLILIISMVTKWISYEFNNQLNILEYQKNVNENHFNFLMNSGKKRLTNKNLTGAYYEFKLAKAIYPKNDEVNQLLLETTTFLCLNKGIYCKELDGFNNEN